MQVRVCGFLLEAVVLRGGPEIGEGDGEDEEEDEDLVREVQGAVGGEEAGGEVLRRVHVEEGRGCGGDHGGARECAAAEDAHDGGVGESGGGSTVNKRLFVVVEAHCIAG